MKRIFALLLVVVMLTAVGCSGSTDPAGQATNNDSSVAGDTPADNGSDANNQASDEPVVLTMAMKDLSPSDPTHQKYIQRIEDGLKAEGINVKLDVLEMPQGSYADNLNLKLLGGDIPDIIYFQGGDKQMADQGILEDLTPYIEGSDLIKNAMLPYQTERLRNYPYLLWIKPMANKVPVVRTDYLNELDSSAALLDNPTIENYEAFFKEMKAKKTDYAFTMPGSLLELDTIFNNAFGVTGTWVKQGDAYVYGKVSNAEKEKLAFYAKLYQEGLIDPEYLTKAWDTKEQAFYSNEAGVISGTSGKVIDIYDGNMKSQNGAEATLTVLPPASGVAQGYNPISVTKETRGLSISALSEHKDLAWKVIEFLASDEGQMIDRLGFEGEEYNIVDNKIQLTDAAQNWYAFFFEVPSWKPQMEMVTPLLGSAAEESLEMANMYYLTDTEVTLPAEYSPQMDAVTNLYNEFSADVVTGKRSIDDWDNFVADWYAQGGQEITDYANSLLN